MTVRYDCVHFDSGTDCALAFIRGLSADNCYIINFIERIEYHRFRQLRILIYLLLY